MFEILNKTNAQEFFNAYMQNKESAIEALISETRQNGIELDFNPESLTPLWQWAYKKYQYADEHPDESNVPIWYYPEYVNEPHFSGPPVTEEAAKIRDKLAYYFGEVVIRNLPNMEWDLSLEKGSLYSYKPIITGSTSLYPLRTVGVGLSRILKKSRHASLDSLKEVYDVYKKEIEDGKGYKA